MKTTEGVPVAEHVHKCERYFTAQRCSSVAQQCFPLLSVLKEEFANSSMMSLFCPNVMVIDITRHSTVS